MNEGLISRLYRMVWTRAGGEPWTDKVRRDQAAEPLLFMLIFLGLGIILVKLTGRYWWQILLGFLLGVLVGHFWW